MADDAPRPQQNEHYRKAECSSRIGRMRENGTH